MIFFSILKPLVEFLHSKHNELGKELICKWMYLIRALASDEKYPSLASELPAFSEDVNAIVKKVGQPHLLTCTFVENLRKAFRQLYAVENLALSNTCE